MSTATENPATPESPQTPAAQAPTSTIGTDPTIKVTQARVIASEWIKFRSVRSSVWTLFTGVLLLVGISALIAAVTMNQWDTMDETTQATLDPIGAATSGSTFAQLALGVLAVLMITGEYTTGMIRASLTVVPRRLPVFWAKLAVFSVITFVITLVSGFVAFFLTQAILDAKDFGVSIGDEHALRAVFGLAAYLTLAGMFSMAIGALLRGTAASIFAMVAVFLVIPPVIQLLPASISDDIVGYLPNNAGSAMFTVDMPNTLSPGAGLAVFGGYTAFLIAIAAWRMRKADV